MKETPKKIVGNGCFLCCIDLILTGRIRVFEKSLVEIEGLIKRALEIDVSVSSSSDPFVCMRCYKRLLRFGKIKFNLRSVQEEIKEDYKKGAVRTKRLRRDTPIERSAAAKSLKFVHFAPTTSKSSGFEPLESHGEASTLSTGHEGILDQPVFLAFRSRNISSLAARSSRRSLGRKDCVTSQNHVCVGGYIKINRSYI